MSSKKNKLTETKWAFIDFGLVILFKSGFNLNTWPCAFIQHINHQKPTWDLIGLRTLVIITFFLINIGH